MNQWLRLALEAGPLAVFFITNSRYGIMVGTAAFMAATTVSVAVSYALERRVPIMPMVGCFFVLLFGGLTLWLDDELFIKIKPTVVNLLFATALFVGMAYRRNLVKVVLGTVMELRDEGWRILTVRWAWFFVVLAALNEIVWRTMSTDAWVNFKVFGIMPLTLAFSFAQIPVFMRYQVTGADDGADGGAVDTKAGPEPGPERGA